MDKSAFAWEARGPGRTLLLTPSGAPFPGGNLEWSRARSARNKASLTPSVRPRKGHVKGTCSGLPTPRHPHLHPPSRGHERRLQTTTKGCHSAFCALKLRSLFSPFFCSWGTLWKAEIQQHLDIKCKLRDSLHWKGDISIHNLDEISLLKILFLLVTKPALRDISRSPQAVSQV